MQELITQSQISLSGLWPSTSSALLPSHPTHHSSGLPKLQVPKWTLGLLPQHPFHSPTLYSHAVRVTEGESPDPQLQKRVPSHLPCHSEWSTESRPKSLTPWHSPGQKVDWRNGHLTLTGVAKGIEHWRANLKVTSSIPGQGTCLGCRPGFREVSLMHQVFSPCLDLLHIKVFLLPFLSL